MAQSMKVQGTGGSVQRRTRAFPSGIWIEEVRTGEIFSCGGGEDAGTE